MLRFIDLFCGIGGFHLGLSRSIYGVGSKCVFASELDNSLRSMYEKNYGISCSGDIYNVDIDSDIPEFDLLMGGFPCQSFSFGGLQKGFDDERGLLIFKIVEILNKRLPKYFILENVKNILHIDGGSCYERIMSMLGENYSVCSIVASPMDIGVPYIRDRVFFLGVRKDLDVDMSLFDYVPRVTNFNSSIDGVLELGVDDISMSKESYRGIAFYDALISSVDGLEGSLYLHSYDGKHSYPNWVNKRFTESSEKFVREKRGLLYRLIKEFDGVLDLKRYYSFESRYGGFIRSLRDCVIQLRQSGIRVSRRDYFPTLVRTSSQTPIIWDSVLKRFRCLNTIEIKRLHGLEGLNVYPSSKSKFCGTVGNSVCVPLVSEVIGQFFGYIEKNRTESV